jgi:hypothetical protein
MIHSSRHLKRLPVIVAFAVVGALITAGSASATHPNVGFSPSLDGYIVPVYKQCTTGQYGGQGSQHATPLAVRACGAIPSPNPFGQTKEGPGLVTGASGDPAVGPDLNKPIWPFSVRYTAPGVGPPCIGGAVGPDVCLYANIGSLVTFTTDQPPYVASAPFLGTLAAVARIRFTDHYNCPNAFPCGGNYQPGTGADLDFGPLPFSPCTLISGKSSCILNTTANSLIAGAVVSGIKTNIAIFRLRIIIPANPPAEQLLGQQGIGWD